MQSRCLTKFGRGWLRSAVAGTAATVLFSLTGSALAQEWPTRPVKLVIALGPGSAADHLARLLAPRLQALWHQPVVVENKVGAGGMLGAEYVANSTDGHTLLIGSLSTLLPKFTTKDLRFDPTTDLVPVYRLVNYQLVIAVNAKTAQKAKNLPELVALSKANPLFFGGTGKTSIFNLAMSLLNKSLGMQYTPIDYKDVGAMNVALMRDDVQFMVNTPSSVKAQIDSGEIRALAAVSPERFPTLPDVPTIYEAAQYKGFLPLSWGAIFAPKGTPSAVVERVGSDLLSLVNDAEFKKQVESRVTGTLLRSSPAAFAKEYKDEAAVWKELFASMNYNPE